MRYDIYIRFDYGYYHPGACEPVFLDSGICVDLNVSGIHVRSAGTTKAVGEQILFMPASLHVKHEKYCSTGCMLEDIDVPALQQAILRNL
jgi:hypothetical protein